MRKKFSILFTVGTNSADECSAVQRLRVLQTGLERLGVETGLIFLGDYPMASPRILIAANTPIFLKTARNYDFVHSSALSIFSSSVAKPFANYKIIFDAQGSTDEYYLNRKSGFNFGLYYNVFASALAWQMAQTTADYFVTVSEPLRKKILLERGIRKEKTELLYNAVDTKLFKPTTESIRDPFTVTYAGAYQKWQGIDNFVESIKILEDTDIKFRLMGFQKRDDVVKRAIKARLGNRVELLDFQPRMFDQQPYSFVDEIARSHILIIPRYTDPSNPVYSDPEYVRKTFGWLPTKFGEFISTGRPVIVTNLDVSADFVKEKDCGFVCNPDPKSMANAILEARNCSVDELNKKGRNGRELAVEQFDIEVVAKKYLKVLSELAD